MDERTLFFVAFMILFFGFLGQAFTGNVVASSYSCEDYRTVLEAFLAGESPLEYDVSGDGIFDATDLSLLYQAVERSLCSSEHMCADIGSTTVIAGHTLACVSMDGGTRMLRLVGVPHTLN